jgi:ATP-binding cassette subfamily C protein LapB
MVDKACKAIDQELSAVFFGKALSIRLDERPRTVGTFASQIRHFESVRNFLTSSSLFILADTPFALMFIGVIALIAGPVALVPLVVLVLSLVAGLIFVEPIGKLTATHMEESNRKNGVLIEAIDGIESIKATAAEWKLLDQWRRLTAVISGSELRLRWFQSMSTNLTQLLQQFSYVGLVAAGAYAVASGSLTMGGLIACSIISGRALAPIAQLPSMISQWKHAQIALKSLDAIMAMPSDRDADTRLVIPERCVGVIKAEKLSFSYKSDRPVITVSSLSFEPGDRVAILGSIGSGKSTLIKLLSGLYRPTSGQLYLDGVDFTQLATEYVREHVGYLPQDVRLFQGTLRENLTLGLPTPPDSQILKAAAWTGLDTVIRQHPKGLELEISEGGRGLSGGQRQLVGLTRMLLAQPRIMLLDEPTASMDGNTEARVIRHLFQEVAADSVLVVVTHKTALLPQVNRIIVVDNGQIILDGPRDKVLTRLRDASTAAHSPSSPELQEVKA